MFIDVLSFLGKAQEEFVIYACLEAHDTGQAQAQNTSFNNERGDDIEQPKEV